jgi:hypothetical protein
MASLADLYGKAKATARQIPANLRQSGKGLASWAVDPYGEAQRVMGEYGAMTPEQRQGLVDTAVDLFGGVDVGPVGAIKASHGSPHLFDRFDFSKIGTGEGAQAYGHGGYFAQGFDSPVAKEYAQELAKRNASKNIDVEPRTRFVLSQINQYGDEAESILRNYGYSKENAKKAIENAEKYLGHLYNVELKWPDAARELTDPLGEQHLLDWNASLSEQPQTIRQALVKYAPNAKPFDIPISHNPTGAEIYGMIAAPSSVGQANTSEILRNLGIPGIRYLNQGSRSSGTGTSNYVMFDDRFPNIVTRNGVSLTDLLRNK